MFDEMKSVLKTLIRFHLKKNHIFSKKEKMTGFIRGTSHHLNL
jgi:hypothetical protein